jgi:hypothetical protein
MKSEKNPDSCRLIVIRAGSLKAARVYNPALVADAEAGEKPLAHYVGYGEVRM